MRKLAVVKYLKTLNNEDYLLPSPLFNSLRFLYYFYALFHSANKINMTFSHFIKIDYS